MDLSRLFGQRNHLLGLDIPHLQAQAAQHFGWIQAGGLGLLHFRHLFIDLRQAVEGDFRIQVVNVVIADELLDSQDSLVIQQAGNRTYAAQAVLKRLLEEK